MTKRVPCPPAPGPLEDYATNFDERFATLAQRRSFRAYLEGLLLPRDRHKTLTALVGTEPIVGAHAPAVQRLQFFLSESTWDAEAVNTRRLELLLGDAATAAHEQGVLVLDDTGDRKAGTQTAHVARQYLGSVGKPDNGIVAVTSLWADERVYFPLHVEPYTPASRLPQGKRDPDLRTKPQIAMALVDAALDAGVPFRAVVADCFSGDNLAFEATLGGAGLPYVLAVKPSRGSWAPVDALHTPEEAAQARSWDGPEAPGDGTPVVRRSRDGHAETWWAAELTLAGYGRDRPTRMLVATTDPATRPAISTWYLVTNLPRPGAPPVADSLLAPAGLAEVVRLYGLRNWVEQSYKQVKDELVWADFMVRTDRAIRRHWQLVHGAFSFCWQTWFTAAAVAVESVVDTLPGGPVTPTVPPAPMPATEEATGRGENGDRDGLERRRERMAAGAAPGAGLVGPVAVPRALLAGVVERAPATRTPRPPRRRGRRAAA